MLPPAPFLALSTVDASIILSSRFIFASLNSVLLVCPPTTDLPGQRPAQHASCHWIDDALAFYLVTALLPCFNPPCLYHVLIMVCFRRALRPVPPPPIDAPKTIQTPSAAPPIRRQPLTGTMPARRHAGIYAFLPPIDAPPQSAGIDLRPFRPSYWLRRLQSPEDRRPNAITEHAPISAYLRRYRRVSLSSYSY